MLFGNGGSNGGSDPGTLSVKVGLPSFGAQGTQALPFDGVLQFPQDANIPAGGFGSTGVTQFPTDAWDPSLRSQLVLAELSGTNWYEGALEKIKTDNEIKPDPLDDLEVVTGLINELVKLRNEERATRSAEIAIQADNAGAYWAHLLYLTSRSRRHTATLVATGFAVGQMVGMVFKNAFNRARPAQLFPALMPAIATPSHPSYPSNHALQSHLVRRLVVAGLPGEEENPMVPYIAALSHRIGKNREIAGVHYSDDTVAGFSIADWIFDDYLQKLSTVQKITDMAKEEWRDIQVPPEEHLNIADYNGLGPLITRISTKVEETIQKALKTNGARAPSPSGS